MALSNVVPLVVLYCRPRKGTRDRNSSVYQDQDQVCMCVCFFLFIFSRCDCQVVVTLQTSKVQQSSVPLHCFICFPVLLADSLYLSLPLIVPMLGWRAP